MGSGLTSGAWYSDYFHTSEFDTNCEIIDLHHWSVLVIYIQGCFTSLKGGILYLSG